MTLRFRSRAHLALGLDLNLGKSGTLIFAGVRCAYMMVGGQHLPRVTTGPPGTDLSVTETLGGRQRRRVRSHHHVIFRGIIFGLP